jgi:hypothetical protein
MSAMSAPDDGPREELLARLAESRQELRQLLEPRSPDNPGGASAGSGFPRSRTMRMLMSNRGLGTLGAAAAGLLVARPMLALRLLRLVPISAVARAIMVRALGAMRARRD